MRRYWHVISFVLVRLLTACTSFLLLTMTVLQAQDHDGYQATHLFFMPRSTWEMDKGIGMLYAEEHYGNVERVLLAAWSAESGREMPHKASQMAAAPYEASGLPSVDNVPGPQQFRVYSSIIRGASHSENPFRNQVPVGYGVEMPHTVNILAGSDSASLPAPISWRADVLTPPPRG